MEQFYRQQTLKWFWRYGVKCDTKDLKEKGIPISVRGSGANAYVEGIANQFEFDHGPQSGWKVKEMEVT